MLFPFTSFVARRRASLFDALARYLAQPVAPLDAFAGADPRGLAALLEPGDVLLTNGNTRAAALVRRLTGSVWAHVSLYVGPLEDGADPRCIVEADVAKGVQAISLSKLKGLQVRVLRPSVLGPAERRRLAEWAVARIGAQYDLGHAWALARRLLRLPAWLSSPAAAAHDAARRFICSSLTAQAFMLVGQPIAPAAAALRAEHTEQRDVMPRDFETAAGFEVVVSVEVERPMHVADAPNARTSLLSRRPLS